ncbi:MAG: DNA polymerase III PolC-type [Chlamydiae bacterium]|nr:DNA polymerase III PolC-type [Chlamydiota bacterium]
MPMMSKTKFVCIDCESTGLDKEGDEIIEIAAVTFTLEKNLEVYDSLVNPGRQIPDESMQIHHITQDMVRGKPKVQEVLPKVIEMISDHIIVGHGVSFDIHLVNRDAKRHNVPCNIKSNAFFDTLRMARLYGGSPKNSLENLRIHFNINEEGAHRALNDVIVNIEVFRKLAAKYKTLEELKRVLEKPIRLKIMPLGKHKGRSFKEIPIQYLKWAAHMDFDQDLLYSLRAEIRRRQKTEDFSKSSNPFSNL